VERDEIVDGVLVSGLDDWVMLVQVEALVRRAHSEAALAQLILETVAVIEAMTSSGLVEVGDVRDRAGFMAWNVSPADAAARIRSEWEGLGRSLEMGDICWLSNTAQGDRRAERLSSST
jgi:hypothetical protein